MMMVESECTSAHGVARSSPMNHRHGHNHILHRSTSINNQCILSDEKDTINSGSPILRKRISVCVGCNQKIFDPYILRVAPDLEWHAACLKCVDCQEYLDERCTCFVRDGKTYCKRDYVRRQFGIECAKCKKVFRKSDYVMKARNKMYHIDCFHCTQCLKALEPGEQVAVRDGGLYCKSDHEMLEKSAVLTGVPIGMSGELSRLDSSMDNGGNGVSLELIGGPQQSPFHHNAQHTPPLGLGHSIQGLGGAQPPASHLQHLQQLQQLSSPTLSSQQHPAFTHHQSSCSISSPDSLGCDDRSSSGHGGMDRSTPSISGPPSTMGGSGGGGKKDKKDKPKTTRVRTVLNEKQLHTLRACYNNNPRPDALMKEHLVEMTGLSARVIRVWFQNKRCKDKKKQILAKQILQQQQKNETLNGIRMQGIGPLIAGSPTRHDMPLVQALDVHQYQQSSAMWIKAQAMAASAGEYHPGGPMPPDHGMLDAHHQTPFQQLMHGFGDPHSDPTGLAGCYLQTQGFGQQSVGVEHSELGALSPQLAPSDLSCSPSCSE